MTNKKNKRLIALLLPLLLLSGVSAVASTYAWWNVLTYTQNETVQVGEGLGTVVNVNAAAPEGKYLVPSGTITDAATQVDSITLKYDVSLTKAVTTPLAFSVTKSDVQIGGSTTYASLVNIAITAPETLSTTTAQLVSVVVTLTEPGDEAVYNAVKNKPITFTLTFTTALA